VSSCAFLCLTCCSESASRRSASVFQNRFLSSRGFSCSICYSESTSLRSTFVRHCLILCGIFCSYRRNILPCVSVATPVVRFPEYFCIPSQALVVLIWNSESASATIYVAKLGVGFPELYRIVAQVSLGFIRNS
jgi:hypothetical protein